MSYLDYPHISSQLPCQKVVVFIHGYGASGENLLSLGNFWKEELPTTMFIAPNGPEVCDENNPFGFQWFGLKDFSISNMRGGLDKARPILTKHLTLLLNELKLTPSDLTLVGFSQGAMMALEMLYVFSNLGGIIGYSGAFYPHPSEVIVKPFPNVLLIHGTLDTVVPYASMVYAAEELKKHGLLAQTHTCKNLDHSINSEGIQLGGEFIRYHQKQPITL